MLLPAVPPRTPLPQAAREDKLLSSPVTKSLVLKSVYRLCKSAGSCLSMKRACAWGVAIGTELAIRICRPWTIDHFNLPFPPPPRKKIFLCLGPFLDSINQGCQVRVHPFGLNGQPSQLAHQNLT